MLETRLLYRTKEGPKIIIIGAGVAGLAAASRLIRNGYTNIKILEAENRIGGRVHSVPLKDCIVDLGAHWVHGEIGNAVYQLSKPYGLVDHSEDLSNLHFIISDGSELEPGVGMSIFEEAGIVLEDHDALKRHNGSLYDFLMKRGKELASMRLGGDLLTAFMEWLIKFECTIEGCNSLTEPSTSGLTHYKQCEGDIMLDWKGKGYQSVIDLLLGNFKGCRDPKVDLEGKLILNAEVQKIDYSGLGVSVRCKGGGVYVGDYVIVTVSLGVLKDVCKTLFHPPLPLEKQKTISGLSIGTVNKIYLKFQHAWWPKDCSGFSLLWLEKDKTNKGKGHCPWEEEIIGFYTENSSPTTLTAWLVGEAAMEMEACSSEQIKEACLRILKKFLASRYDIPEPEGIARSSWYSNPHFRGSYSFRSLNSDVLNASASILAKPLKNTLGRDVVLFAGEATHECYYSTVHGAIETGWREANYIMAKDKSRGLKSQL